MSKLGVFLCSIYAALIIFCVTYAQCGHPGLERKFTLLQMPIAPQIFLLQKTGLLAGMQDWEMGWVGAYLFFAVPAFALLYLLGWIIDRPQTR